jgi:hypothetical protein
MALDLIWKLKISSKTQALFICPATSACAALNLQEATIALGVVSSWKEAREHEYVFPHWPFVFHEKVTSTWPSYLPAQGSDPPTAMPVLRKTKKVSVCPF